MRANDSHGKPAKSRANSPTRGNGPGRKGYLKCPSSPKGYACLLRPMKTATVSINGAEHLVTEYLGACCLRDWIRIDNRRPVLAEALPEILRQLGISASGWRDLFYASEQERANL